MKSILFLGGGQLGLPSIKWAKEIGFNIIVNDKNPNATGFELADVRTQFDSTDIKNITIWSTSYNDLYNIQYCYCGSDFGLLTATNVHLALNIPSPSIMAIINSLDKYLMKKCWKRTNVKCPKSIILKSEKELISAAQKINFPLVIKPSSSSGSQGVSIISNAKEAKLAYIEANKFAETGYVICEEYIRGTHHDVNGLFWNNKFYPCCIGDRFFTPPPYPVPHHGYFPSTLKEQKKGQLYTLLEKGARSMGINHGPVKADCVIRDEECYIYEISARFHGDIFTANTLGYLNEKNPIYQLLKMIYEGSKYEFKYIEHIDKISGWKTLFNSSEVNKLNVDGIYRIKKNEEKNQYDTIKNNTEIAGLIWASRKDHEELYKCLKIDINYE